MENTQPQSKLENSVSDELPSSIIPDSVANEQESTPELSNDSNISLNDSESTNEDPEILPKENEEEEPTFQDILGSGDLTKKIIRHGNKDDRPTRGERIVINMVGKLEDEDEVIEKYENKEITLGDCEVIQGVDLALSLMNVGEIAVLKIAPRFGYGEKGLEPNVPGGAKLIYTVELISAQPELQPEELTPADRLKIGQQKKDKGNWWYLRNENTMALHLYRKAIQYFGGSGEVIGNALEQIEIQNERVKTLNNMAVVHMAMNSTDLALQSVDSVLSIDPINVKAIMRKGKILTDKGQNSAAAHEFKRALHISPNNKTIQSLLANVENVLVKERAQEKELYKKMLGQKNNNDKENKIDSSDNKSSTAYIISGLVAGLAVVGGFCYFHNNYPFSKINLF